MEEKMNPSSSGLFALGGFVIALVMVTLGFCTPYWLEGDPRIYGNKFEKLGLWTFCFRSLSDPQDKFENRYYTGCRWIFDPFTTGWGAVRQYYTPAFFIAVQFFFTMCFIFLLIASVMVPMYLCCFRPEHDYYVLLIRLIAIMLLASGFLGTIAVIIFGVQGNSRDWITEGWDNNYLSWSFGVSVVGVYAEVVTGALFLVEARVQARKRRQRDAHGTYEVEIKETQA